jgi:hypothetical protein
MSGSVVMIPKQINNPYFDVAFKGAHECGDCSRRHADPGWAERR